MKRKIYIPSTLGDSRLDSVFDAFFVTRLENAKIDFERLKRVLPAGHAIMACFVDSVFEQKREHSFPGLKEKKALSPSLEVLAKISSYTSLPRSAELSFVCMGARVLCSTSLLFPTWLDPFIESYRRLISEDREFSIRLIMNELIQNTVDHSGAERFYCYIGLHESVIHFGVLDLGTNIPARMRQKYHAACDLELLELAFREGYGTRRMRAGGLGLSYFREHIKSWNGRLAVYSGDAYYRYYYRSRTVQKGLLKRPFHGTWCFGRIPLNGS